MKLMGPIKIKLIAESRMKNDYEDSGILSKFLKDNRTPESYVSLKENREICNRIAIFSICLSKNFCFI